MGEHEAPDPAPRLHECRIEHRRDDLALADVEQYLIRCHCHSSSWKVWRPGDAPFVCPSEESDYEDLASGLPSSAIAS